MSNSERDRAIANVRKAFTEGTTSDEQRDAIMNLIAPGNEHFCMCVLDAAEVKTYPESKEEKRAAAHKILVDFMKSGNAPEKIVDYAANIMAGHMTMPHQVHINQAFRI
jgi:hypothetical protein